MAHCCLVHAELMSAKLLFPANKAAHNRTNLVPEVRPTVDEGSLVPRVLALSIGAEPVVRPDTQKVIVDRHDLAVQLWQLVETDPDPGKDLLDRFHLG